MKIKGYGKSYASATDTTGTPIVAKNTATGSEPDNGKYKFKVTLISGKIEAAPTAP